MESTCRNPSSTTARNGRPVRRACRFARISNSSWMSSVVFLISVLDLIAATVYLYRTFHEVCRQNHKDVQNVNATFTTPSSRDSDNSNASSTCSIGIR